MSSSKVSDKKTLKGGTVKHTQHQSFLKKLWKDESAQGATEYILLLVVVVGLVLLFKDKIKAQMSGLIDELSGKIGEVTK